MHGHDWFGDGYGEDPGTDALEQMRRDWKQHRDEIMAEWNRGAGAEAIKPNNLRACRRPWAWWTFDAPEPHERNDNDHLKISEGVEADCDYLARHRLLSPSELDELPKIRMKMQHDAAKWREVRSRST